MAWQRFLASLDSPGGHVLILCLGVLVGSVGGYFGVAEAKMVVAGAGGALLSRLRS